MVDSRWIIAGLLVIPLVDIAILVYVASVIGAVATIAVVVLTALIGLLLVRAEGRHTLRKIQRRLNRGELPTDELLDGGLLIAAGAFLLTPGLVTDAIGFLIVIPPTRWGIRTLVKRIAVPLVDERTGGFASGRVYTAGFPNGGTEASVHDLGPDAYDVDVEGPDDEGKGNA